MHSSYINTIGEDILKGWPDCEQVLCTSSVDALVFLNKNFLTFVLVCVHILGVVYMYSVCMKLYS